MSKILIRGAKVLGGDAQDVLIDGETIEAVGAGLSAEGADVIEAEGKILLPGLVDLHTHLREPGREDSETVLTGTRAAASGGYTAVFAMANTFPVADTAGVVEQVYRLGQEHGYCDVQPSVPSPSAWRAASSPSWAPCTSPPPGSPSSPTTASACTTP